MKWMSHVRYFSGLCAVACVLSLGLAACGDAVDGVDSSTPEVASSSATTAAATTTTAVVTTTITREATTAKTTVTTTAKPTTAQPTTKAPAAVDTAALNQKLDAILNKHGRTPLAIYNYVHDNYKYKHAAEGSIEENALYLMENGTGSCYHFAALTYLLFKRAGYDTRYVTGLGWQTHTYHCWIMANFDGGWYHVDSLYVRSAKMTADTMKKIGYEWDESQYPS